MLKVVNWVDCRLDKSITLVASAFTFQIVALCEVVELVNLDKSIVPPLAAVILDLML